MISIIVAIAENYAIGLNNDLLWHIPEDLRRFKKITSGHKIIMGKRTYESLPVRPLPNRTSIVISDDPKDVFNGCIMAYSIEEAMEHCDPDEECFVIGGGMIYRQFLPLADKLYITKVNARFDADTFFPEIDPAVWEETENEPGMDENSPLSYSFITFLRKKQAPGNAG
jgi:dihydrofolate reductase